MPPAIPVRMDSMNWTPVVVVGLAIMVLSFWFIFGRRRFKGPEIDWDLLQMAGRVA